MRDYQNGTETWRPFISYCPNCSNKLVGFPDESGMVRIRCRKCMAEVKRKRLGRKHEFQELDTSETDFKKTIKEDCEEVFDDREMPIMMDYLKKNLDMTNLCILLMFVTGLRVGEAVALKHSDFIGKTIKIRRTATRYLDDASGKYVYDVKNSPKTNAGVRTVIIPDGYTWICERVRLLNPFSEYIFVKDEKIVTTNSVRCRLYRICKKLGICPKSPHKIRKTYASVLLDNGLDNNLVIGQMGHTDIACTEAHYHRNRRNLEEKAAIISKIPEFCPNSAPEKEAAGA